MDNADLERLKVAPGRLVPKFHSSVTEYNVTVGSNIEEIKLTTLTSDSGASCTIKGDASGKTVQLKEGTTSVVEIVVTAEDGKTNKTYTLSIKRLSSNDACLSQLEVSAGSLQPSFNPSNLTYYCDLPSNLTTLSLKPKLEDPGMKISSKNGSPLSSIPLSPGLTVIDILVTSPNGTVTTTYTINAMRLQCPYPVKLTNGHQFTCTACSDILHCPCYVRGNNNGIYCQKCLHELSRINKADPLTGGSLGEGWMVVDHKLDSQLSTQQATCITPHGTVEGSISDIPVLINQQKKPDEITETCNECSKKVPGGLLDIHKNLTCSSKLSEATPKTEVTELYWQKRLYDVSISSDMNIEVLLTKGKEWEQKYIASLKSQAHSTSADILDPLFAAGSCYATAISIKPKDPRGHVGLGLVMEEAFYVKDFYGHKSIEGNDEDSESEAEISSKEEEFLAICELHGVSSKANIALQLKAVEAEYHSLKEAGQTHRSEQVQKLYQWMSKKVSKASKGSYSVESESPLYKAKLKFEHAVTISTTDHSALYNLGRISLLLGDVSVAGICLKLAASVKPTHPETLLCLGQAISSSNPAQAKILLLFGLTHYLKHREQEALGVEAIPEGFHSNNFWRPTNTLIGESFLTLASLGGHDFLNPQSCLLLTARLFSLTPGLQNGSTVQQLLWLLLRARASLLNMAIKEKSIHASNFCQQLSALIVHCQLPPNELIRELQMKVFEDSVTLQPCNSISLSHLGNGQLQQFEATGDKMWLNLAEKSFRASISLEGKPIDGTDPPEEIKQQEWWIKRNIIKEEPVKEQTKVIATDKSKATIPATGRGQPVATGRGKAVVPKAQPVVAGRGKAPPSKGPPVTAGRGQPIAAGRGKTTATTTKPAATTGRGKAVATLGELKNGQKVAPPVSNKQPPASSKATPTPPAVETSNDKPQSPEIVETPKTPTKTNDISYIPRLGLARTLARQDTKATDECIKLYREVLKMSPSVHDAYIELGEILAKSNPLEAVEVYSKFPFTEPPSFDDAYLHGEVVRLLMSSSSYDDPRLATSMIAMGKALGIGVLDRHVATLEAKFKTSLLKEVYAGVHGKSVDNPDLQAFFKFKCWL